VTSTSFDHFRDTLQRLGGVVALDPAERVDIQAAAKALQELEKITRTSLASFIKQNPRWVPHLAASVGISKELLRNLLRHELGTTSHMKLARDRSRELVRLLDREFGLVKQVASERDRVWTFADVLIERTAARSRASGSIRRGRDIEDQVEAIVRELGLSYKMRTFFVGLNGQEAGCDLAVPGTGASAEIVGAMKGFDSTGSKQSDAVNEIRRMADVREPRQFVFVVVDGMAWKNRQKDLGRIYELWERKRIDGLFNLSMLADFRSDLKRAARLRGLLPI
jgi:hypothetical protein